MGKSVPQAPTPPDPVALANAQGAANKDTAITSARLNAVDTVSPFGSVTYTETPGTADGHVTYDENGNAVPVGDATPHFTQTTTLSPDQQALYDTQLGIEKQAYGTAGQALQNVQGVLSSPFSLGDMPPLVTGINGGTPQSGFGAVNPLFGIASGGNIQTGIGDPGAIQNNLSSTGQQTSFATPGGLQTGVSTTGQNTNLGYSNPIQTSFAQGGSLAGNVSPTGQQTGLGSAGPIQSSFGQGGPLAGNVGVTGQQTNIAPAGSIQNQISTQGLNGVPLTADAFKSQGDATTNALMQRFNQDWANQQENTQAQLNAQGIQLGSKGYDTANQQLDRARNDALSQALLAGNQVQNTLFNQQLAANQNQFGQNQAQGQFANAAQAQGYGQNANNAAFANQALNALQQQQLNAGQFQNATAGQQYAQNQGAAQFANQAQNQGFGQALAAGQFSNDALNAMLQQQLAAGQFQNATAGQQFGQNQALAQFGNQAQQQGYQQALGAGQFANDALNNQFQQNVTAGNFGNAAQAQGFGQNQAQGQFTNQALQSLFGQNQASQAAQNAAQQQLYAQLLGGGQFANQAQAQQFGQNSAQQQAYNQAAQQQTGNNQALASFYNTAQGQAFSQAQANAALQNQARQQAINEQLLQRSQPINEIATLLGLGGGIQVPQGAPNFGVNVAPTDVLGAYGLNQQAQQNNYNQAIAAQNAGIGGIANLLGTLGGAALLHYSDARLKTNIRISGKTANGIPLYLYSYKDKPETEIVGVMAQDMMSIDPIAVHERNGFYAVDYARVA